MIGMAEPRRGAFPTNAPRNHTRVSSTTAPPSVGTVAGLWFACCWLLAAGRSAELGMTVVAGSALAWLVLPIVIVGLRPIVPGMWLARASLGWAVVQVVIGVGFLTAAGPATLSTNEPVVTAMVVVPLILMPTWLMAYVRLRMRRRTDSPIRPLRTMASRTGVAVITLVLAAALGLAVTLIGTATWSDEPHVFAALSATLTTGLGFTWWIVHHGRPDQRTGLAASFLLLAFVAVDVAVQVVGPLGIAFQSFAYFFLVTALAHPRRPAPVPSVALQTTNLPAVV